MKQILQNLKTGQTLIKEVPEPGLTKKSVLIQTKKSLISPGTERMLVEFSRASLLGKARSQPERVKQVLEKIRSDGLLPTLETIFRRLDEPLPLGYNNAGIVLKTGEDVTELKPGDRVVSNGAHAEIVSVPKMLCAKIPDDVTDEQASFAIIASIGLHGVRLLEPTFKERFVVYGLGLIGLISIQILLANGCDVLGIDINSERVEKAQSYGIQAILVNGQSDPILAAQTWSNNKGVDGVLITASTDSNDIIHQAAQMCRKRARIILVGTTGLKLLRNDFYEKELLFRVSCSYGPGRYDELYEQEAYDYPYGYIRWTAQRNFEAVLCAMSSKQIEVDNLITHRVPFSQAPEAYNIISETKKALGIILDYPSTVKRDTKIITIPKQAVSRIEKPIIGVIGAGNFSKMTLMPGLKRANANIAYIADLKGVSVQHLAHKYKVRCATTDYKKILADDSVNVIFIATRHNLHARLVIEGLEAGKHVFTEKPLAINAAQLKQIIYTVQKYPDRLLMVGFNRRFSPHALKAKELLTGRSEPLCMNMVINAGFIAPESWVHSLEIGGGRIIGEGCHFMDLMVFLTGSLVKSVSAAMVEKDVAVREDKMSITLSFQDGSIGTISYFANGSKDYPKERLQIFSDNRVLELNNFRFTFGYNFKGFKKYKTTRQDKGHYQEFSAFIERISLGGKPLIPLDELINVTCASFAAVTAAQENRTISLAEEFYEILPK